MLSPSSASVTAKEINGIPIPDLTVCAHHLCLFCLVQEVAEQFPFLPQRSSTCIPAVSQSCMAIFRSSTRIVFTWKSTPGTHE